MNINLAIPGGARLSRLAQDRRMAAPAFTIGALAVAVTWAVIAQLDLNARQAERDAKSELADRLSNQAAARGRNASADLANLGSPFIDAETATTAAAEIDRLVRAAVAKAQGAVVSTQAAIDTASGTAARRIGIRAVIEGRIATIQRVLLTLETSTPVIFIDELALQPKESTSGRSEKGSDPQLQVSLALSAFWRSGL